MAIFKWKDKTLFVTNEQIYTYNSLSASHSYNTEEKKNGKKMPKTKDVGPGIGTLSINVKLSALTGNDVKAEHDSWVERCEKGLYAYIFMGGTQFGNYKWRIKQVDVSDLVTINDGETWKSCTLSISFEEYYVKVKKTKAQKKAEKLQKKMWKQLEKAENSTKEKARTKALEKAKTLAAQFVEAKTQAAAEMAERAKIVTSIDDQIHAILYPEKGKADQQDGQKIINS